MLSSTVNLKFRGTCFRNNCFVFIPIFVLLSSDSGNEYSYTTKAFIFSIRNKEGLSPFKSMVKIPQCAIYRHKFFGPTFGRGHQIYIAGYANSKSFSYTDFGEYNTYSVPSGVQDSYTILAGSRIFTPDD